MDRSSPNVPILKQSSRPISLQTPPNQPIGPSSPLCTSYSRDSFLWPAKRGRNFISICQLRLHQSSLHLKMRAGSYEPLSLFAVRRLAVGFTATSLLLVAVCLPREVLV